MTLAKGKPRITGETETDRPLIKQIRLEAGLTQEDFAKKLDVAVSTVRRWEKQETEPTFTLERLRLFCKVSGKKFEELPKHLSISN